MTLRDNLGPNRARSFAFSRRDYGTPDNKLGQHVLKKLPGLAYVRPTWDGTETVIRVYPGIDPNDKTKFEACRVSEEMGCYGNWQCCYEAVRRFGEPGVTFLLHDGSNPHYNPYMQNPCWILFRAIKDACEKGQGRPDWFPLLNGADKRGATLQRPTEVVLVQCAVFRHNNKDYFSNEQPPYGAKPHDPTVVFELSKSTAMSLFNMIDERTTVDWKGDPNDAAQFKHGDPVAIDDGVFVHIYERGTTPNLKLAGTTGQAAPPATAGWTSGKNRGQQKSRGGAGNWGYDVHLTKTLDGGPGDISASLTGGESVVRSKVRPWSDILHFMTDTEQAHMINTLFPASAIVYAFRDRKDWITDDTRKAAVNSVSVGFNQAMPVGQVADLVNQAAWQAPQKPVVMPSANDAIISGLIARSASGDAQAIAALKTMGLIPESPAAVVQAPVAVKPTATLPRQSVWGGNTTNVTDVAVPVSDVPDVDDSEASFSDRSGQGFSVDEDHGPDIPHPVTPGKTSSASALELARQRANLRGRDVGGES